MLKDEYCRIPVSESEFIELADETNKRWNFPNGVFAINGKHIALSNLAHEATDFYNYKAFHSIVLMAMVIFYYQLLFYDAGCPGKMSQFCDKLINKEIKLPPPQPLPLSAESNWQDLNVPFVVYPFGDSAFSLSENLMIPYSECGILEDSKRIFNDRLSRFQQVSENAFGIWSHRFRLFQTLIDLQPEKVITLINASVALHNMLCKKSCEYYFSHGFVDGVLVDRESIKLTSLQSQSAVNNLNSSSCVEVRDIFAEYFSGLGKIRW